MPTMFDTAREVARAPLSARLPIACARILGDGRWRENLSMFDERNSRVTRVQPIFGWLKEPGDEFWPARFVSLAHGVEKLANCGPIAHLDPELELAATPARPG
jgi:hypothetical protein